MAQTARKVQQPTRVVAKSVDEPTGIPDPQHKTHGAKFVYVHYALGWQFDDAAGFLPVLNAIKGIAAVNGVREDPKNPKNLIMGRALGSAMEKGGIVLYPEDARLGPYQHYVARYDTESGGSYYVAWCEEATVIPGGRVIWNSTEAGAEFTKFRAYLRDNGLVHDLIHPHYLALLEREINLAESLEDRSAATPALSSRAKKQRERVEAMRKAWDAYEAKLAEKVQPRAPQKAKRGGIELDRPEAS